MRQTFHIFKKDVRHLWFEIAVLLSVVVGFAFTGARQALWLIVPGTNRIAAWTLVMFLLPIAWWTLIARVIHDEALPGDRQFWITRPYSWKSLLGAKALFILVFISLPMLLADGVIVHAYGLPFWAELPGLLWSQVLLAIVFVLPIIALSVLTNGFVQLMLAILAPCVIAFVVTIVAPDAVLGSVRDRFYWVNAYSAFLVMTAAALAIVTWQYWRRRTVAARSLAVAAGILVAVVITAIPWPAAFKVQSWFSKQPVDESLAHVDLDSGRKWLIHPVVGKDGRVSFVLPFHVEGLPPGMGAKPEGFSLRLEVQDGATWQTKQLPLMSAGEIGQEFSLRANVDGAFYEKAKDEPLKVRGSVYLTLFGNKQTVEVPFADRAVLVPRVGVCSASGAGNSRPYFLVCSSAFRFPAALVSYRFLRSAKDSVQEVVSSTQPRAISYSPFPAELGIGPISQDFTFSTVPGPLSEAAVETVEPLAYIRRDFEINNVRLGDFEVRPTPVSP